MKLLLVEDQKHMAYAIEGILKKNKYIIDLAFDGVEGLDFGMNNIYDAIILDIMLPYKDGFEVLKTLRENNITTPIIMLTAKSDVEDKVKGLNLGADDYLPKPFDTDELLARIKSITRRGKVIEKSNELNYKEIFLNMDELKIRCREKEYILTLKEAQLLEMFLKKPNIPISKDTIINKIWSYDKIVIDNNVEVYISFLRKKLLSLDSSVKIKTMRGLGYKLVGDDDV